MHSPYDHMLEVPSLLGPFRRSRVEILLLDAQNARAPPPTLLA